MVTATQSAHKRELSASWGKPADHGLAGVLDTEKRSSTACQFERALREKVVGQDQAVQAVVDLYQMYCAGMQSPSRPIGNLLFLGPTGSGKTRIVEAAAEILFGDSRAVVKVDCAEFQHSHEIAKLIWFAARISGAPRNTPTHNARSVGRKPPRSHETEFSAVRRD